MLHSNVILHPHTTKFYAYLRHEVLAPHSNRLSPDFTIIYGSFPPERRYNQDQVPLPFVVCQDTTFTTNDDKNMHIKAPSEALRKRQATMHLFMNAGAGDKRDGYTVLIAKGKFNGRRKIIEKNAWNKKVKMLFQINAWVDTEVMVQIAKDFVEHVRRVHGDLWVLLFCDNLNAHLNPEVKRIFYEGKVFILYFPPNTTESIQLIDADYGCSVRINVGNLLDKWLESDTNMEKWEGKLTASERRVLLSHLVAEATDLAMKDDKMRIGCFKRTGCLMTYHPSDMDNDIKPQGVTSQIVIPSTHDNSNNNNFTAPSEQVTPEQELLGATDDVYENEGDVEVNANDLCMSDDEGGLLSTEMLEDVGVEESDEDE